MSHSIAIKSSFTLPPEEVILVMKLKKKLKLKSNTEVIRQALYDLETRLSREELRRKFREASALVKKNNQEEMLALDQLAGEDLEGL